jgi:integrase
LERARYAIKSLDLLLKDGAQGRIRTTDTRIFSKSAQHLTPYQSPTRQATTTLMNMDFYPFPASIHNVSSLTRTSQFCYLSVTLEGTRILPTTTLTAASVERLKPPSTGQVEYYDRRLPSFGLRLSYHGTKSWFVMTRLDGKLIRVTLGKHPVLSLGEARDEARRVANLAAAGKDPRQIRANAKQKRREDRRNTFDACAEEFLQKHVERHLRPSTQREYRRILNGGDTRVWRGRPISQITKHDVMDVIEEIDGRGSPGAAKRALAYLRKFFNWCAERDIVVMPPTDRIRTPHPEVSRDRVLAEEELRYLLPAIEAEQSVFGPLLQILLLTGQRRAEVAGMLWTELVNLEDERALWELPGDRTKNKYRHLVPLAPLACNLLLGLPRVSELVFTTTGDTPVSGFGKLKARLDVRINEMRRSDRLEAMRPWTLHDLRRTMVTVMNERLSIAPHVVEAVVNHISGGAKAGVAGVYNRALYLDDRRVALGKWEDWLYQFGRGAKRLTTRV